MEKLFVQTDTHPYFIYIGQTIRNQLTAFLPKKYNAVFIISDDVVAPLYLDDVLNNFSDDIHTGYTIIPNGEQSKSIDTYYKLQTEALQFGLDRKSLIIALGGGVVGDLAGFAAATYMRGIDYIQVPTTILAHDSSVGGKVAINHERGKNLIGSFYPPKAVVFDTETLKTLPEHEVRSGYAELIKEALIAEPEFFQELLSTDIYHTDVKQLAVQLQKGVSIKAKIVQEDERENGMRKFLNLGHTLGHALESELGYGKLTHGEAVAIGTLFALGVSRKYYSCDLPYDAYANWLITNKFPLKLPDLEIDALINRMKSDKKTVNEQIQLILLEEIGTPEAVEINDTDLRMFLESFMKELVAI